MMSNGVPFLKTVNVAASFLFAATVFIVSLLFVDAEINIAREKPLWLDEYYGLASGVRGESVTAQLLNGTPGQGSPAPLDYILLKVLDAAKTDVGYLGLEPLAYFRLVALFSILIAGVFIVAGMWTVLQSHKVWFIWVPYLFVLLGLVSLWFNPSTRQFAAEMRPYSLWNSIWAMSLVVILMWPRKQAVLIVTLALLSFTATASIFQLFALFVAFVSVNLIEKRSKKQLVIETIGIFSIPTIISLYYALRAGTWHYTGEEWGTWPRFFEYWLDSKWVFIWGSAAAVICFLKRETRIYSVAGLTVVFLYFLAPLIFFITRSKGFFFTPRQYIYFDLALPVLFFSFARCFPYWLNSLKPAFQIPIVVLAVFGLWGFYDMRFSGPIQGALQEAAKEFSFGFPEDANEEMKNLLERELPKGFCVVGGSEDTAPNFALVQDWLPVRYKYLPQGNKTIFVAAEGNSASVNSIMEEDCIVGEFYEISS